MLKRVSLLFFVLTISITALLFSNSRYDSRVATVEVSNSIQSSDYFRPYIQNEKFYEDASLNINNSVEPFDSHVSAGILPHHLIFPEYISYFFEKLAATQKVDTFVVIGPNHFMNGDYSICASKYGFSTPYGDIKPNLDIVNFIIEKKYAGWDERCFSNEHSINSLTSFIKKYFPDAKIVAIVTKYTTKKEKLDEIIDILVNKLGDESVLIGSIDFSHYMPQPVADFHDEMSRSVIENFDLDRLWELEIDSGPSLYSVLSYAKKSDALNVEILNHTNSASKINGRDFVPQTTSHFYVSFKNGKNNSTGRNISVAAFGDIMLGRYVRTLIDKEKNIYYPFLKIFGEENRFFMGSDVLFANLEGPISGDGYESGTSLIFGFKEDVSEMLSDVGFDILSIANNHTLNRGITGLSDTYKNLNKFGVSPCGNPVESESKYTASKDINGTKVAFACFNDIGNSLKEDEAASVISSLSSENDYVLVSIHWGNEYQHTPNKRQMHLAHKFIDAGASFVIGHHPHVVQPFEIYNGKFIFYSLGNFVFDQYWSFDTQEQLGIGIVLGKEKTKVYLFPMLSVKSQPILMDYEERKLFYDRFIKWGNFDDNYSNQIRASLIEI